MPEKVYDAIVLVFYKEARERLIGISKAIEANDLKEVALGAHALKGSSGNLRLTLIHETAKALEMAAQSNNLADAIKCKDQLKSLIP